MTDVLRDVQPTKFAGFLFGIIAVVMFADLVVDWSEGAGWGHIAAEALVLLLALIGVVALVARLRDLRTEAKELRDSLEDTRADAVRWREQVREHTEGLSSAIDDQFDRWELTDAERQVARLLLKGLSMKEVAAIRDVSSRTVRQQAHAVYKKGGLGGRADLSAFFLEDLLAPAGDDA